MTRKRWTFLIVGLLIGMFIGAGLAIPFEDGVPWRAYVDQRMADYDHRMEDRFESQQRAIEVLARSADLENLAGRVDALEQGSAGVVGGAEKGASSKTTTLILFGLFVAVLQIIVNIVFRYWKPPSKGVS